MSAHRDVDIDGTRFWFITALGEAGDTGKTGPALTATTANALGIDGRGGDTGGHDGAVVGDVDGLAVAGRAAGTADCNTNINGGALTLARKSSHRRGSAAATTAADAVCQNAFAEVALGQNRAVIGDRDRVGIVARAAFATHRDIDFLAALAAGKVAGEGEATIAATAADALRKEALGLEPFGVDAAVIVDRDLAGNIAGATAAADGNTEILRRRLGVERKVSADGHAAIATAAAGALGVHRMGVTVFRFD